MKINFDFRIKTVFILIFLVAIINAQEPEPPPGVCLDHFDCAEEGYVCRDYACQPCRTSAECLEKTFMLAGMPSTWFTIAMVAVLISIFAAGIVYVIAHSFNIESVKRIGRAELMQAGASLVLVGLLFGVEAFGSGLVGMLEQQTGMITAALYTPEIVNSLAAAGATVEVSPFDVSYAFVRNLINCAQSQWEFTYETSVASEILANLHLEVITPLFKTPVEWSWFVPTVARKVAKSEYLADELTWLMIVLYAQLNLLRFIEASMFTLFLPIGIILRAFPPTRGAGAVMIAIAIGLYIVFPLTYTILYIGTPPVIEGCYVQIPQTMGVTEAFCPLAPTTVGSKATTAMSAAATLTSELPRVESGVSQLRYVAYLYLLIALGTTFIFVRSISGVLGADISEIGRSMMRLI